MRAFVNVAKGFIFFTLLRIVASARHRRRLEVLFVVPVILCCQLSVRGTIVPYQFFVNIGAESVASGSYKEERQ